MSNATNKRGCRERDLIVLSPSTDPQGKAELRRSFLQMRRQLSVQAWQSGSQQICDRLKNWPQFQAARTVLGYFSFQQEPDLSALFASEKTWGFPRCVGKSLFWHRWLPGDSLVTGDYGIAEPSATAPLIAPQVDLILIPCVAIDRQGYRLGYGGGYYDRLLSDPAWANKPTIGIAFEQARVEVLPSEPWDRPLRAVCTEAGCFTVDVIR